MSILWGHGSSWKFCSRCSRQVKGIVWAWKHLWIKDCSMWFMWEVCYVEGHGHSPDSCSSKELIATFHLPYTWVIKRIYCCVTLSKRCWTCMTRESFSIEPEVWRVQWFMHWSGGVELQMCLTVVIMLLGIAFVCYLKKAIMWVAIGVWICLILPHIT